jgi:hypothetical protein
MRAAQHRAVDEIQESRCGHATFLGQRRRFGQRLGDDPQHQVVAQLNQPRLFTRSAIGHAGRDRPQIRFDRVYGDDARVVPSLLAPARHL